MEPSSVRNAVRNDAAARPPQEPQRAAPAMRMTSKDPAANPANTPKSAPALAAEPLRTRFGREALLSADWYQLLARLYGKPAAAGAREFAAELALLFNADGYVILHYPQGAAPRLLHGHTDRRHRANSMDEYLDGHYALDPFYLRSDYCSRHGMVCLRDVIEEGFGSSEYYKRHYQPAGLTDELCFCTGDGAGGHLNLALSRVVGKVRFSRAECEAARTIAPLVNAVLMSSWKELSPAGGDADASHHQRITHTRLHFGRSVLTEREFEILQQLLQGKSMGFIARHLAIAASTVKVHRKHIYAKLGIKSQAELFALFLDVIAAEGGEGDPDPLQTYRRANPV